MELVESVRTAETELAAMSGKEYWDLCQLFLLRADNDDLFLPVDAGMYFSFGLCNLAYHMVGYPTFLARDGKPIVNIFAETATILDPNRVPADGGMPEAGEATCDCYDYVNIDGIKLPGNQKQRFVASNEFDFGGMNANGVLIFRRTRPGVTIADVLAGGARGGSSSDLTIGVAQTAQQDCRQRTGLDYLKDARDPIFNIKIISRQEATTMLERAGLSAPQSWTCSF